MNNTKKPVGVVIATIGRDYVIKTIPITIQNIAASLRKVGVAPFFIVEDSSSEGLKREVVKAIKKTGERVDIIPAPGLGPNAAWDHGFNLGIKKGAFAVVSSCDDYFNESKQFDRLIRPLLEGRAEVITGGWSRYGRNILSFPKPQYLNEVWISRLMSFANPHTNPRTFKRAFLNNPNSFQTFSAMIALRPEALIKIHSFIRKTFKDSPPAIRQKINGWGNEPIRVLAALSLGLRTENVQISARRFEHSPPRSKEMERFIKTRFAQYNDGVDAIREFLIRTNQAHKLKLFERAVAVSSQRISQMSSSTAQFVNRQGKRRAMYNLMKEAKNKRKPLPILGLKHSRRQA